MGIGSHMANNSTALNFAGVTAFLQTPELVEVASEVPLGTMYMGVVATPSDLHYEYDLTS